MNSQWRQVTAFETLFQGYRLARAGKRYRKAVATFSMELESELLRLQTELVNRSYRPSHARVFTLYDRKPRLIAAPAFRDRVVHHALMSVVGPALDDGMYPHSYACRAGKGVHAATSRYQAAAKRYSYVLKLDVRQYFASIQHDVIRAQLAERIPDNDVLWLFDRILQGVPAGLHGPALPHVRGLPIGNLTSQILANLYLTDFDFWVAGQLGCGAYIRYVDDLFVFGDDKARLWSLCGEIEQYLYHHLGLALHPDKRRCRRTSEKVDVLGYQVSRRRRWLRSENGYRFRRRLRRMANGFAAGELGWSDMKPRVQAWIGHAIHGETSGLRKAIFSGVRFRRASALAEPRAARRVVE